MYPSRKDTIKNSIKDLSKEPYKVDKLDTNVSPTRTTKLNLKPFLFIIQGVIRTVKYIKYTLYIHNYKLIVFYANNLN